MTYVLLHYQHTMTTDFYHTHLATATLVSEVLFGLAR